MMKQSVLKLTYSGNTRQNSSHHCVLCASGVVCPFDFTSSLLCFFSKLKCDLYAPSAKGSSMRNTPSTTVQLEAAAAPEVDPSDKESSRKQLIWEHGSTNSR
jgi:hypothetical protein